MVTGEQLREARERAGMTQEQVANAVKVSTRSVGNWERSETVPRNSMGKIRHLLGPHLDAVQSRNEPSSLTTVSDAELVAEVARRMSLRFNVQVEAGDVRLNLPEQVEPGGSAPEPRDRPARP